MGLSGSEPTRRTFPAGSGTSPNTESPVLPLYWEETSPTIEYWSLHGLFVLASACGPAQRRADWTQLTVGSPAVRLLVTVVTGGSPPEMVALMWAEPHQLHHTMHCVIPFPVLAGSGKWEHFLESGAVLGSGEASWRR